MVEISSNGDCAGVSSGKLIVQIISHQKIARSEGTGVTDDGPSLAPAHLPDELIGRQIVKLVKNSGLAEVTSLSQNLHSAQEVCRKFRARNARARVRSGPIFTRIIILFEQVSLSISVM